MVQIYTGTSTSPGTLVATMTNPGTIVNSAVNIFTAPANTTLAASTTYWLVTSNSAGNGTGFRVSTNTNNNTDSGTAAGWSIGLARFKNNNAVTAWTNSSGRHRFRIRGPGVANNPPTVATAIPDQTATAGTAFSYAFPDTTFNDADTGQTLSYMATKADGTALPTWLAFTAGTRTFVGTPAASDVGTVSVKVTASDGNGVQATRAGCRVHGAVRYPRPTFRSVRWVDAGARLGRAGGASRGAGWGLDALLRSRLQEPSPERLDMRLAARRFGGDQAATRAQVVGLGKHRHQHSLLQFGCNERGASEGHPQARRGRVNQHAAETEARGVRQVRRKEALGREPGRPLGWPAQMVEQGPGTQVCRVVGLAARLEKLRTTDGEQRLLEQLLPAKDFRVRRPGLAVIGDPKVEVSPVGGAAHVVGLQRDGEVGPAGGKGRDFRHEPPLGKGFDRDDAQAPLRRRASVAVHDCSDLCEETLNVPKTGLAAQVQLEPAATAVKQGMADVIFEYLDAVGDGRGGDLEFRGGADEALMPGGGIEEAETLKGRQGRHHLDSEVNTFDISELCHNKKRMRAQVRRGRSGAAGQARPRRRRWVASERSVRMRWMSAWY